MNAYIAVADFELHMEDYHDLRVNVLNHQLSGVAANRRDLNLFLKYLNAKGLKIITGEEMLKFMGWLREERDNNAGSINRKESSIRSYLKYLRFFQVKGADAFPIEYLPRARQSYPGPVEALTPEEVYMKLLPSTLNYKSFIFCCEVV